MCEALGIVASIALDALVKALVQRHGKPRRRGVMAARGHESKGFAQFGFCHVNFIFKVLSSFAREAFAASGKGKGGTHEVGVDAHG